MAIEEMIKDLHVAVLGLTAQLKVNGEFQERLIAGQAAAIDKVEGQKATRTRKAAEPAAAAPVADTPKPVEGKVVTEDDIRAAAAGYLKPEGVEMTAEERKTRGEFLKAICQHLGTATFAGEKATLDGDGRKQAAFFIARKAEGLPVDFSAEYDFDGEPTQGDGAPADDTDDMIG